VFRFGRTSVQSHPRLNPYFTPSYVRRIARLLSFLLVPQLLVMADIACYLGSELADIKFLTLVLRFSDGLTLQTEGDLFD